uniref:Uncharacterized protein n=1 Tax=Cucumis sativus TaxID=3659 RepID=A0A0A0KJD4_CUCSA
MGLGVLRWLNETTLEVIMHLEIIFGLWLGEKNFQVVRHLPSDQTTLATSAHPLQSNKDGDCDSDQTTHIRPPFWFSVQRLWKPIFRTNEERSHQNKLTLMVIL